MGTRSGDQGSREFGERGSLTRARVWCGSGGWCLRLEGGRDVLGSVAILGESLRAVGQTRDQALAPGAHKWLMGWVAAQVVFLSRVFLKIEQVLGDGLLRRTINGKALFL